MDGAQFDRAVASGGADAWDNGAAGVILREDYFPAAAPAETVYVGAVGRSVRYVGTLLDSQIYLGAKALFP